MAHLVGQGELAVQGAGVVQQHEGMDLGACGVSAAPLALVLIDIDPAVLKALLQNGPVAVAQRIQRIIHGLLGLGKGDLGGLVLEQRGIHIVEVQLLHAQQLLAQADIAVHLVHVPVDRLDQIVVDGYGHIGPVHGRLPGRAVLPGGCEELLLLVLGIQQAGGGVAHAAQGVIEVFVGALAQRPVAALLQGHKGALAQGMGLSLAVYGVGIAHIGIEKGAENGFRSVGHLPGGGQQPLFGGGEGVCLSAALVVQIAAVPLQPRGGLVEALQGFLGNGHDLGGGEAERGADGGEHAHELANHGLIGGVAGVLVRLAHGVVGQQLALAVHVLYQVQECAEGLAALAQLSGKGGGFSLSGRQGGQGLLPAFIRGVQVLQRPGILLGDLVAGTNGFGIRHS